MASAAIVEALDVIEDGPGGSDGDCQSDHFPARASFLNEAKKLSAIALS